MIDGFGRKIEYLRLSVTEHCNFRCRYCTGDSVQAQRELLSPKEFVEIARAAAVCGIRKLRLTGGEPLLRQDLPTLCRMLKAVDGIEELAITTNGSLLADCAAELREAGVDRVNISLDTLDAEKFRAITRTGALDDVLRGIAVAKAAGFAPLKLNTVLLGGINDNEIADLAALTKQDDISVRFIELMPMAACAGWPAARFLAADTVLKALPQLEYIGQDGVAELYRLPRCRGTIGLIRPMSRQFCGDCNRIRVTADGTLKPCLHSAEEIPLRGLRGAALQEAMERAILQKPKCHHLTQTHKTDAIRSMQEIGG